MQQTPNGRSKIRIVVDNQDRGVHVWHGTYSRFTTEMEAWSSAIGCEQRQASPADARGIDQSLRALTPLGAPIAEFASGVNQGLWGIGIATTVLFDAGCRTPIRERRRCSGGPHCGFERTAGYCMLKASLVSVVDDDPFFRESMRRLMRSLGYTVEI